MTDPNRDLADASLVLAVASALAAWEQASGRAASLRPLREAIWFYWERPRLPKPLVRGKYPEGAPWSQDARELHLHGDSRGELVIEHAAPMRLLMRRLIDRHGVSAEQCLDELQAGGRWVVITRPENARLAAAGVADQMPGNQVGVAQDPWARHRHAGLDVDGFAPLRSVR